MSQISPFTTFLCLFIVGASSFTISTLWPENNIQLGQDIELKFAKTADYNPFKEKKEKLDVNALLASYHLEEDSIQNQIDLEAKNDNEAIDSAEIARLKEVAIQKAIERLQIQLPNKDKNFFDELFEALENSDKELVDVLHYGDSQIETDRITNVLRKNWQGKWGGKGPGLVPVVEVVPSSAIKQKDIKNFERFTLYGKKDHRIEHKRYGLLAAFGQAQSIPDSSAFVLFEPSRLGYSNTRSFQRAGIFYGYTPSPARINYWLNDSIIASDSIGISNDFKYKSINFQENVKNFKIEVIGDASPEFYAINFGSYRGVQVHNIPMRGSSGTLFKKIDQSQLAEQYKHLNTRLVLLQYGGNSVPYVKDSTQAQNYGRWFAAQITRLKQLLPEATFVVIGPSDMATKEGEDFVTYPYLTQVRDALKAAALNNGCAFWDIYEVMGGKNSMESWVNADPPLAGKDYVHFTSKGAKEIAELFNQAFMKEYAAWKLRNGKD